MPSEEVPQESWSVDYLMAELVVVACLGDVDQPIECTAHSNDSAVPAYYHVSIASAGADGHQQPWKQPMLGPLQPNLHCYVLSFPNFAVDPSSYCPSPDFHDEAAVEEEVDTEPVVEYDGVDNGPEKVQGMAAEGVEVDPTAAAEEEEEEAEIAEGVGGIGIDSSTMNQVTGPVVVENAEADSGDPPWTAVVRAVVVVADCTDAVVGSPYTY